MRSIPVYQVDAFTDRVFCGNPAAVCPLDTWLDDELMQSIAMENNLSETVFIVPDGEEGTDYGVRWFTPTVEVALCGHATLASAFVIFNFLQPEKTSIAFSSRSGVLDVIRSGNVLTLNFPARLPVPVEPPAGLCEALRIQPEAFLRAEAGQEMSVAVLSTAEAVRNFVPDLDYIAGMRGHDLIVTAPGVDEGCDFVSRYFAPHAGIPEDPVTGSAHCITVPYWAGRLGRTSLKAHQISARGGELDCELRDGRVYMSGRGVLYLQGTIFV